ncbi:MAG TPA: hypothetical protein VH988_04910 [Thermoanaerobaculia bacterium]|jgi:hypothetical protein|nr:hypothetical protein [Thermoanaerobaculia bacterium]
MLTFKQFRLPLFVGFVLFIAAATANAFPVSGTVYYEHPFSGLAQAPSFTNVKICLDPGGRSACGYSQTSGATYSLVVPYTGTYYVFMSNDRDQWGSDSSPSYNTANHSAVCSVGSGGATCNIAGQPRPLGAAAALPVNGEEHAPLTLLLKWRPATDTERSAYPATYDIWGHGLNGTDLLQFENIPCNADANGFCQVRMPYAITGNTLYYWHIVTKLFTGNYAEALITRRTITSTPLILPSPHSSRRSIPTRSILSRAVAMERSFRRRTADPVATVR